MLKRAFGSIRVWWILLPGVLLTLASHAPLGAQTDARPPSNWRKSPGVRPIETTPEYAPNRIPEAVRLAADELGPDPVAAPQLPFNLNAESLVSPRGFSSTMNMFLLLTVLSLAPSILIMTTCFIRFIIVFSLLRQALGTQQMPPNQVLISLSLFLTFMVMAPVWKEAYEEGVRPYTEAAPGKQTPSLQQTFDNTVAPIRGFMGEQIEMTGNDELVWMFIDYQRPPEGSAQSASYKDPETFDEVPLSALLPAYMLSELKTSFIIGFQIYLPFLIIDMVISSILISMGMMMLPPVLISLPFKLLLFVLVDGWGLTVGMLLRSINP
jgi:flagellar biosynthetic protein FliP